MGLGHKPPMFTECSCCRTQAYEQIIFQPRRKCEDSCLGNEKLHTIRNSSHSHRVFASNLMIEMFSNDELTHLNCNVNGKDNVNT